MNYKCFYAGSFTGKNNITSYILLKIRVKDCLVLYMHDIYSSSFSISLLLTFNPLTCSHACWGASCSCSPERCLHRISHGGSSHWHQVDHDASVLETVPHGILSSSAFYFSCPVGLVYSSLNQRNISIPHSTITTQFSER